MSRKTPYQWICLRAIKPRTHIRSLATETSTPEDPKPSTSNEPPTTTSTSDLKSYLQSQDTAFLHATKSHLDRIHATAQQVSQISKDLPTQASKINILPDLPPYTTHTFRLPHLNLTPPSQKLLSHIGTLQANLTDLQYIPYPSETGPSKADKFKKKLSEWTQKEKEDELMDLRGVEESHAGRLLRSTEGLKKHVEELRALGVAKGNPFAGSQDEVKGKEGAKASGFGAGATDIKSQNGDVGKAANPFKGSAKEKEKKATADAVKAKDTKTAADTAKAKDTPSPPTKVADAVDVPKPKAKANLKDLQAMLSKKVS